MEASNNVPVFKKDNSAPLSKYIPISILNNYSKLSYFDSSSREREIFLQPDLNRVYIRTQRAKLKTTKL